MSAQWVAGSVRSKAMARRRLGAARVRALAASASLQDALTALSDGSYGPNLRPGMSLAQAQHAVGDALLWNLRVLAGWLPATGAEQLRVLAGWFEVANVDEQLRRFRGEPADPPYRMGRLATAWPRLTRTSSPAEVRAVLAASAWGDPGGESPRQVAIGIRLALARRVTAVVGPAGRWAAGAVALLVARELFAADRRLPEPAAQVAAGILGPEPVAARSLADFGGALHSQARWALAGVRLPTDLWRAETNWWSRLHRDGLALLAGSRFGPEPVIGACALLAADAWQINAALELAARGGGSPEMIHAVA